MTEQQDKFDWQSMLIEVALWLAIGASATLVIAPLLWFGFFRNIVWP